MSLNNNSTENNNSAEYNNTVKINSNSYRFSAEYLKSNVKRDTITKIIEFIFFLCASIGVISLIAIIGFVFYKGLRPFVGTDAYSLVDFLTGTRWAPSEGKYGIFYMIVGSVFSTIGAIIIGVPLGILTAVYIAELANKKVAVIMKSTVELLAGIPSILYGAFGLGIVVPLLMKISPKVQGQSMFAVIIILSIMILPTIVSLSESALRAVPKSYYAASMGLGASKMQTIFKVIVPAAKSGIMQATILGIGRAIGETMAVMMIAGNPTGGVPGSIWDMIRPLTTNIAMEMSYASGRQSEMLFATGVILFIFIMIINFTMLKIARKEK